MELATLVIGIGLGFGLSTLRKDPVQEEVKEIKKNINTIKNSLGSVLLGLGVARITKVWRNSEGGKETDISVTDSQKIVPVTENSKVEKGLIKLEELVKKSIKLANEDARDIKRRMKFEMKRSKKVVKATKKETAYKITPKGIKVLKKK